MDLANIKNLMIYSTVRITAWNEKEESTGTGFFVGRKENQGYLTTNKHVVVGYNKAKFIFCKRDEHNNPLDHVHIVITIDDLSKRIIEHPDPQVDLCFIDLNDTINEAEARKQAPYILTIPEDLMITPDELNKLTAIENVIMIGYPEGVMDQYNNKPVVRRGITASHIDLNCDGKKEFMVDVAVFHGSSGSPVFIEQSGPFLEEGHLFFRTEYHLAGVLYGAPKLTVEGELKIVPIPTGKKIVSETELMTNLGYVIKAERIKELLDMAYS